MVHQSLFTTDYLQCVANYSDGSKIYRPWGRIAAYALESPLLRMISLGPERYEHFNPIVLEAYYLALEVFYHIMLMEEVMTVTEWPHQPTSDFNLPTNCG